MQEQVRIVRNFSSIDIRLKIYAEDGVTLLDDTYGDAENPLYFKVGANHVAPAINKLVIGAKEGERRKSKLPEPALVCFGEVDKSLILNVPIPVFENQELGVSDKITLEIDGANYKGRILSMDDNFAKVDFNHELAGEKLVFKVEILKIY